MAKRKISKKKISIFALILVIVVALIIGLCFFLGKDNSSDNTIKVESVDKIEGYDYTLKSNATKYYKSLFKELKEVLEADDIDESQYADLVVKLFVADFFNLDNKSTKNDIGGVQFVYKDFRSDFEKLASSSIYKNVESDLYGSRNQSLPIVTKVSVEKGTNSEFKYGNETDSDAYVINFDIEYKEDLGYQKSGSITLIHNDKKLEVASLEETSN
ncbi:MAG: hypothetical protein HFH45_06665 [Bacilli bacterium]|nr:hypothetical protein [Bacilli bacterium]